MAAWWSPSALAVWPACTRAGAEAAGSSPGTVARLSGDAAAAGFRAGRAGRSGVRTHLATSETWSGEEGQEGEEGAPREPSAGPPPGETQRRPPRVRLSRLRWYSNASPRRTGSKRSVTCQIVSAYPRNRHA